MPNIILDLGDYHTRTNLVPPKKGPVTCTFYVSDQIIRRGGESFDEVVNYMKGCARLAKVNRITLRDLELGFDPQTNFLE